MAKKHLTTVEKAQAKVAFTLLIVGLCLHRIDLEQDADTAPVERTKNPAIQQCIEMISEILDDKDADRRELIMLRIALMQKRLTKKVSSLDSGSCLIGFLNVLTSGFIKSKAGTRLDHIIQTFKQQLDVMYQGVPYTLVNASKAASQFKKQITDL